jgi:Tfp pilus assembly protein PilX
MTIKMKLKKYERNVRSRPGKEQGVALIATLLTVIVLSGLGLVSLTLSMTDTSNTARFGQDIQALYAAEAGLENAVKRYWADYVALDCTIGCAEFKDPAVAGNLGSYIEFLDGLGIDDGTTWTGFQNQLSIRASIQQVDVTRTDDPEGISLAVTSVGTGGTRQVTLQETIRIEGKLFKGFEYGLFANNINCIMCHARFDNVERVFNTDPSKYGTFDRMKVAALQDLQIRTDKADSFIAGTLYTTGTIRDKSGTPLTDLASTTLDGYQFDSDGHIVEPGGTPVEVDLTKATGDPLPALENLYVDYPTDPAGQVDGDLPTSFPPPIPDGNGDRLVDASEFAATAAKATGAITGGVMYGVPAGSSYTSGTLPSGNSADLPGGVDKTYTGNLILVGTDAKPIIIDGTIAVDGDVIITGKVEGTGNIVAKGNIYVVGDTTYADGQQGGDRTFGVTQDKQTENALALTSGNNILVGDYLTPKGGDIDDSTDVDPGGPFDSGEKASFTQSELTLFNKAEYQKAQADSSYTPRYYQLRDGDPVYRFDDPGSEHGDKYDETFLAFTPDAGDAVVSLSPAATGAGGDPWISESKLKQFWMNDDASRTPGTPFQIDGMLYSSNAIFALSRTDANTGGTMTVNGAMVSADMGVLVPGENADGFGLELNYDKRVANMLRLKDPEAVRLARRAWQLQ